MLNNTGNFPILSVLAFLPAVGALALMAVPKSKESIFKNGAFAVTILNFLLSLLLLPGFIASSAEMQFVEWRQWIPGIGASYHLGLDGITLFLVLLTTFITMLAVLSSFTAITKKIKEYYICLLFLETGMLGVFLSLDMLLFYFFWEVMLIPMYFLIGIWGHDRRIYAAVKFILYTMAGSAFMLVGILVMYFYHYHATGIFSFDYLSWYQLELPFKLQFWLFLAFFIAFAIKVPLFPFHTWLPDAHVEAPTAGSVILAGVLLKMGTYGLLRFCIPLFPAATLQLLPYVCALALIGIVYGGLVAMVQPDMKKLVAYSSVAHLGYVVLGLFVLNIQGMTGGLLQMVNHGLSTGALFLLVGMLYERRHTRLIEEFGGIAKVMPAYFGFFLVVTLSSIGLPMLNGFVGEFNIILGAFSYSVLYGVIANFGIIIAAVYMFWMFQRVMFGEVTREENKVLKDLNLREYCILIPLVIMMFWIGIYPKPFISRMEPSVQKIITRCQAGTTADYQIPSGVPMELNK
jgi:NADH-quinone oxidoreductase subunit M